MNRDGQEKESGTIRRDPARTHSRRDDQRVGEETRCAPSNGTASDRQRDSSREEDGGEERAEARPAERTHRPDAGSGSGSAAKTTAHCASDLDAAAQRAPATSDRRANRSSICTAAKAGTGT